MLALSFMEPARLLSRLIPSALAGALLAGLALAPAPGTAQQGVRLPDMGSSAGTLITPSQEAQYGAMLLREFRRYGMVLDDPLVDSWLQGMGYRLASVTENAQGSYTFFMVRSRQVNAFATLGGVIGMNAGLVLTAETEDEVAAVMAHEIAHVTQRHIVRAVEAAQKDQLPILLGMLAGVIAAQSAGSGDGAQAAIAGGMGLMMQRQINHTRSAEQEADRLGIQTLARAGYDPNAMADFFGRMGRVTRHSGGDGGVPEFLRTHPVTTARISEARDRASRMQDEHVRVGLSGVGRPHPLLPSGLSVDTDALPLGRDTLRFDMARERLRVLTAPSTREAVAEYRRQSAASPGALGIGERYGYALARIRHGQAEEALQDIEAMLDEVPDDHWLLLARAEALHQASRREEAMAAYDELHSRIPENLAITLSHAQALIDVGDAQAGARAMNLLRPIARRSLGDYSFQRIFARAAELAGDEVRAAEAHAEAAFLAGRAEDALNQLRRMQSRDDLDYIQRGRIDARIAEIHPIVLEMQRQGIGPDGRRRGEGSRG